MGAVGHAELDELLGPRQRRRPRALAARGVPRRQRRCIARVRLATLLAERPRRAGGGLGAEDVDLELGEATRRLELGPAVALSDGAGVRRARGGRLTLHPFGQRRQPVRAGAGRRPESKRRVRRVDLDREVLAGRLRDREELLAAGRRPPAHCLDPGPGAAELEREAPELGPLAGRRLGARERRLRRRGVPRVACAREVGQAEAERGLRIAGRETARGALEDAHGVACVAADQREASGGPSHRAREGVVAAALPECDRRCESLRDLGSAARRVDAGLRDDGVARPAGLDPGPSSSSASASICGSSASQRSVSPSRSSAVTSATRRSSREPAASPGTSASDSSSAAARAGHPS